MTLLILEREINIIIQMTASGAAGARDVQRVRKARICALQQACYKVNRGLVNVIQIIQSLFFLQERKSEGASASMC